MKIVNSFEEAKKISKLCIALGNFDGVHLGHQQLMKAVVEKAKEINGTPAALTFFPHPSKVIKKEAVKTIITEKRKIKILNDKGIKVTLQLPFTMELAQLEAEKFLDNMFMLDVAHVVVGFNYTFGKGGKGDGQLLEEICSAKGVTVQIIPPVTIGNKIVSSSSIRQALLAGDITQATAMLGDAPLLEGRVVMGNRIGRQIGFPTANIQTEKDILLPSNGVYLILTKIKGKTHYGLLNIGIRPTLTETKTPVPEVHIFEFSGDLYGQNIEIYLLGKMRDERKFNSKDELIDTINKDILKAKEIIHMQYKKSNNIIPS